MTVKDVIASILVIALGVILALHFVLNRQWVFASGEGYVLHLTGQGKRYLVTVGVAYAATSLSLFVLSGIVGWNALLVYYGTAAVQGVVTFLVFRRWVFRTHDAESLGPDAGVAR